MKEELEPIQTRLKRYVDSWDSITVFKDNKPITFSVLPEKEKAAYLISWLSQYLD